ELLRNDPIASDSTPSRLNLSMNSVDCFYLAQRASQNNEFISAQTWAQEALQRFHLEETRTENSQDEHQQALRVALRESLQHFQSKLSEDITANVSYLQKYNALCRGEKVPSLLSELERSQLVCFHMDVSKLGPDAS